MDKEQKEYHAFQMGKDYALHGANKKNCNFSLFSTRESMEAWERGKREANKPPGACPECGCIHPPHGNTLCHL